MSCQFSFCEAVIWLVAQFTLQKGDKQQYLFVRISQSLLT